LTKDLAAALDDTHFYVRGRSASSTGPQAGARAFGARRPTASPPFAGCPAHRLRRAALLSPKRAPGAAHAAMDLVQDTEL
jgi:hypothetical protein